MISLPHRWSAMINDGPLWCGEPQKMRCIEGQDLYFGLIMRNGGYLTEYKLIYSSLKYIMIIFFSISGC